MPIASGDIDFRLSGGGANSDVNASLGGAKSSTEVVDATVQNLFANVPGSEAAAGSVKYRCIYVHNAHGSLTLQGAKVKIQSDTSAAGSDLEIALGTSAVNGTEQTVADEDTAPTGVTWESAAGTDLTIGDIPAGQHKAIWIKRTISASAAAATPDSTTIRVTGDTDA